jgi:hypothetical protein
MSAKTPSIISAALTVVFLIVFVILVLFVQMLALNGASERQGVTSMGISLACQGVAIVLAAILAGRLTNLVISKFNWNNVVAVIVAVIAGTFVGGLVSFLSVIIAIPVAGIW